MDNLHISGIAIVAPLHLSPERVPHDDTRAHSIRPLRRNLATMHMAAAVASNPHRSSATVRPRSHDVRLRCSSSLARIGVDPAEVLEEAADNKQAAAAAREQQRHRSRDEENPRPSRHQQRDEYRASPDRKRRRENVSHYRDTKRSSSSGRLSAATGTSAYAHRRDRDDAYRAGKKKKHERRDRDRAREDVTRKRVSSGASRTEQRARANRSSAAAVTKPHGATVDDDNKPTPEKVDMPQNDEAEIRRRQEIQRQREEARREINKMVKTVEFNDPFISSRLHDVLNPRAH
jgi:hypothetical protein